MKPFILLKCIAKALVKHGGNALGFGVAGEIVVGAGEDIWKQWGKEKSEKERAEEWRAVARMTAEEIRQQVEQIVREVAAGEPEAVRERVRRELSQLPDLVMRSIQSPAPTPRQASELVAVLSMRPQVVSFEQTKPDEESACGSGQGRVVLVGLQGTLQGREFVFTERTTCVLGKKDDCNIRWPLDETHQRLSRYHTLLDIDPPLVRARDLDSMNGTFVNGELIGKRKKEPGPHPPSRDRDLHDGDTLSLSKHEIAVFRVRIEKPLAPIPVAPKRVSGKSEPKLPGYIFERRIGAGGMGEVWLARYERTGERVAIKTLLPEIAAEEWAVKRFLREMTEMRRLRHPNIVRLLDSGFTDGTFYLVQEYCDGGSISKRLADQGPLPVDEAIEIILQTLAGLEYAHGERIVHRDLKPDNIFVSGFGSARRAKIGDFGLVRQFDECGFSQLTRTGSTAGTPSFMPRQQVLNFKCADPAVDVWATAATLYALLTGHCPREFVEGEDPWLTVLEKVAVPIRQRNPKIEASLADVIDKALRDNPTIGFQTAREFKDALEEVV